MRHVGDDRRADVAADRADALEVDHARIGARADHDHLRLVLVREPLELVVVDPLVVLADAVGDDGVELAGEVQRMPVRQVAAVREVHAEDGVARLQQREVHRHVRLRAGVRLHVGVLGAEQRLRAGDRQRLGDVDELAAAVVALARIPFGVLVRQHRAGGFEDGLADEVLGGDELEAAVLAVDFLRDRRGDLGIGLGQRAPARAGLRCSVVVIVLRPSNLVSSSGVFSSRGDLIEPPLVPSALERRGEPQRDDLVGEAEADDAAAHREDVGVVVLRATGGPCRDRCRARRASPALCWRPSVRPGRCRRRRSRDRPALRDLLARRRRRSAGSRRRLRCACRDRRRRVRAGAASRSGAASARTRHGRRRSRCA